MKDSKKIYQIFVSSTYKDLQLERNAAMSVIVDRGNVPIGMEHFPAGDEEQFEYIKKLIENVDYYVLIIAGCYGTICPRTGKSYTEMEFDYAVERKIPIAVLVRQDIENLNSTQKETDDIAKQQAIVTFRKRVQQDRVCAYWNNKEQLKYELRKAIDNLIEVHPRKGFVRDVIGDIKVLENLKQENKELREKIRILSLNTPSFASGKEQYEIEYTIIGNIFSDEKNRVERKSFTWDQIFITIADAVVNPVSLPYIGDVISERLLNGHAISDVHKNEIINQFIALDLIVVTNCFGQDVGPIVSCTLSDKGRKMYALLTAKKI